MQTYAGMKGYTEKSKFDIYECTKCDASFVDPLSSDESMYNHIYRQAELIPGYRRYSRFAELVTKVSRPLDVLANLENTYWAVRKSLIDIFGDSMKNPSILEVGSGLGYLTYSLNKAGYKTLGLDISREAVSKAKDRYGDFYEAGDLFIFSKEHPKRYDCIIMTELLEHIENPKGFIEVTLSMLKDGGSLIITTPNKTKSKKGIIWQSDVPPVHLWWFSEKSIHMITESLGKTCKFIDFTQYTKKFFEHSVDHSMERIQKGLPVLLANGNVVPERMYHNVKSKLFDVRLHSFLRYVKIRLGKKTTSARSSSICVVITN